MKEFYNLLILGRQYLFRFTRYYLSHLICLFKISINNLANNSRRNHPIFIKMVKENQLSRENINTYSQIKRDKFHSELIKINRLDVMRLSYDSSHYIFAAKSIARKIHDYQGRGHSLGLHSQKDDRARELAMDMQACRIIVNQAHCFATGGSFDNGLPFSLQIPKRRKE